MTLTSPPTSNLPTGKWVPSVCTCRDAPAVTASRCKKKRAPTQPLSREKSFQGAGAGRSITRASTCRACASRDAGIGCSCLGARSQVGSVGRPGRGRGRGARAGGERRARGGRAQRAGAGGGRPELGAPDARDLRGSCDPGGRADRHCLPREKLPGAGALKKRPGIVKWSLFVNGQF